MRMILVFLEGLRTLSIVYEKVKIFEVIESRKIRRNTDAPSGLKRFSSYMNIPGQYLALTKL